MKRYKSFSVVGDIELLVNYVNMWTDEKNFNKILGYQYQPIVLNGQIHHNIVIEYEPKPSTN